MPTDPYQWAVIAAAAVILLKALLWRPSSRKARKVRSAAEDAITREMRSDHVNDVKVLAIMYSDILTERFQADVSAWITEREITRPSELENELRQTISALREELVGARRNGAQAMAEVVAKNKEETSRLEGLNKKLKESNGTLARELASGNEFMNGQISLVFRNYRLVALKTVTGEVVAKAEETVDA